MDFKGYQTKLTAFNKSEEEFKNAKEERKTKRKEIKTAAREIKNDAIKTQWRATGPFGRGLIIGGCTLGTVAVLSASAFGFYKLVKNDSYFVAAKTTSETTTYANNINNNDVQGDVFPTKTVYDDSAFYNMVKNIKRDLGGNTLQQYSYPAFIAWFNEEWLSEGLVNGIYSQYNNETAVEDACFDVISTITTASENGVVSLSAYAIDEESKNLGMTFERSVYAICMVAPEEVEGKVCELLDAIEAENGYMTAFSQKQRFAYFTWGLNKIKYTYGHSLSQSTQDRLNKLIDLTAGAYYREAFDTVCVDDKNYAAKGMSYQKTTQGHRLARTPQYLNRGYVPSRQINTGRI